MGVILGLGAHLLLLWLISVMLKSRATGGRKELGG